jgi:hypothetical protein
MEKTMRTDPQLTTSRRLALGQLAAAGGALAAAAAVPAEAATVDPHPEWAREVEALEARGMSMPEEADADEFYGMAAMVDDRICEATARTDAGLVEQLNAVRRVLQPEGPGAAGLDNAIASLSRRVAA